MKKPLRTSPSQRTLSLILYRNPITRTVNWWTGFKCLLLFCRAPTESPQTGQRPPVAVDSEVYKMLQENQESDEPPRQSASFRVLQEILETGTDPGFIGFFKSLLWISNVIACLRYCVCWNRFVCVSFYVGDSDKPSGFRSVKAPSTKIGSSVGNAQKLPVCDKCGSGIV